MHGIDFIQDLAVVLLVAGFVGWLCHRAGLSVVVGFLVAGMLVGPHTPLISVVTDVHRIETLAQIGLVFLMFSIGMKLSLRKLRKLGLGLVLATVVEAMVVYQLTRMAAGLLRLTPTETIFLAGMLMISSSAIIMKVLAEIGATHEKAGQMAIGVFVVEDVIAVLLLTGLGSYTTVAAGHAAGHESSLGQTALLFTAFVVLAGVLGVLLVPWLLRKLSLTGGAELPTLVQAGLLFVLATLAARAGFSLALGAFLLGAIVADTPQRVQVDRAFEGLRDVFSAVFFVAIGMMIDLRALGEAWLLVLVATALALGGRSLACATGLLLTGSPTREAVRVGLLVVPLGEFAIIIAQLGVEGGVLPGSFQAVAVGVALLTTLAAPVFARYSETFSEAVEARQPDWLSAWLKSYQGWLERLRLRGARNMLWQLTRKRLIQIGVEIFLVTGLLAFSGPLQELTVRLLPPDWPVAGGPLLLFWSALGLLILAPVVAIWRNLAALAMLVSQVLFANHAHGARLAPLLELVLKFVSGVLLFLWLSAFLPLQTGHRWLPVLVLLVVVVVLVLFSRKLVYWHSVLEVELKERLEQGDKKTSGTAAPWLAQHSEWELALTECALPDLADMRGRTLGELALRSKFGCTVAGVERQGVMVGNPGPHTALFPRDKVLLLGDPKQTAAGKAFLTAVTGRTPASNFDDVRMETVEIPPGSKVGGRTLADLAPSRQTGVQVAGINRGGLRILNPGGDEKLLAHDDVLVFGSPDQLAAFKSWVREE